MNKILALLVSLLLTIFPNNSYLEYLSQTLSFPGNNAVCEQIAEFIKENDADSIYSMFCEADKQNNENLKADIQNIINTIDGTIIKAERGAGGSQSDYSNLGVNRSKRDFYLDIDTVNASYRLLIFWVTVDTESPEKVGLSSLTLRDSERNLVAEAF